jgi:TetR/AcrR family transcriptional regulator, transcriptional repressor for nem operon
MQARPARRPRDAAETRRQLVGATTRLMMRQGFSATTVDQICAEAGLSKGSFFHHFETKEAIGLEAMAAFAQAGMDIYATASHEPAGDPLEELHRLFDIMAGLVREHGEQLMCMVGMLSQELAATNDHVREAGEGHMNAWVAMVARMLTRAKEAHRPEVDFDAESVSWMLYSIWQGSMLIGKTRKNTEMILDNLRHGRNYVDLLFNRPAQGTRPGGQRS